MPTRVCARSIFNRIAALWSWEPAPGSTGTTFPAVADINDNVAGPILRSADETVFAMDLGVSFDVSVNDTVAIRVIQPNFNITNYGEETQSNFRFSTGVIFSFGGGR